MSEVGDLLVGIAAVVGSVASAVVLIWTTVRSGRKPERVAKSAAEETAAAVLEAVADGELSPADVEAIQRAFRKEQGGDQS